MQTHAKMISPKKLTNFLLHACNGPPLRFANPEAPLRLLGGVEMLLRSELESDVLGAELLVNVSDSIELVLDKVLIGLIDDAKFE